MLTDTQLAVLKVLADDFEDLERISKSICLVFSSE
jgi:hypothetical protein